MKTTILARLMNWRQRANGGDRTTIEECGLVYGENIGRVVRHIVRTGNFDSELGGYVQKAMARLQQSLCLDRGSLIREVTQEVCTLMAGFSAVARMETLKAANEATMGVRFGA